MNDIKELISKIWKRKKTLILHIGRHKSGTTSLQNTFSLNKDSLKESGIYYPSTGIKSSGHHILSNCINFSQDCSKILKEFNHEVLSRKERVILVSSEGFQNCDPKKVKFFFSEYNVKVVFYLRDQVSYLKSAYAQKVQATLLTKSIDEFERDFPVDYLKFYNRWEEEFGCKNIIVRPFNKNYLYNKDVVDDFYEFILKKYTKPKSKINYKKLEKNGSNNNSSLKGKYLSFKLRFNKFSSQESQLILPIYKTLNWLCSNYEFQDEIISRELKETVLKKYQNSNVELKCKLNSSSLESLNDFRVGNKYYNYFNIDSTCFFDIFYECVQLDHSCKEYLEEYIYYRCSDNIIYFCDNLLFDAKSLIYAKCQDEYIKLEDIGYFENNEFIVSSTLNKYDGLYFISNSMKIKLKKIG